MTLEDQHTDRKSLRTVTGKTADWEALAKDCVCFANGAGGRLLIGIEDGEALPPAGQVVPPELLDRLRKRLPELTVKRSLDDLVDAGHVTHQGERRWRRYRLSSQEHKGHGMGELP